MIISLFQLLNFFLIYFLSTIDFFNVFSKSKVKTLIQPRNFVYLIFNFEMFSLVIKTATDVNKAVELLDTIPILGLIIDIMEVLIADPEQTIISVIINNILFKFKIL